MLIGAPKEIKNHQCRVGLTPSSVRKVISHGHEVIVETNAGSSIGMTDTDYETTGAGIVFTAAETFECTEMVVKVKSLRW